MTTTLYVFGYLFVMFVVAMIASVLLSEESSESDRIQASTIIGVLWPASVAVATVYFLFRPFFYCIKMAPKWKKAFLAKRANEKRSNFVDEPGLSYRNAPKKEVW